MQQTTLYRTAVIIHALHSLFSLASSLPALLQGPNTPGISAGVPQVVMVLTSLLGVAGLISAYGAWYSQRWGVWLTVFVEATSGLIALPGVLFGPNPFALISSAVSVLIAIFVIAGLLRRPQNALSN